MSTPEDITTAEAARLRGCSVQSIRYYASLQEPYRLKSQRFGNALMFRRADVLAYVPRPRARPKKK